MKNLNCKNANCKNLKIRNVAFATTEQQQYILSMTTLSSKKTFNEQINK